MFGCYRKGDANDPETYTLAIAAVLAEYTPDVVRQVTDPRSGLPSRLKWLPSVSEVKEACDDLVRSKQPAADAWGDAAAAQLAARKHENQARAAAPTREEMKTKGLIRDKEITPLPADRLCQIVNQQIAAHPGQIMVSAETRQILEGAGYRSTQNGWAKSA